MMRDTRPADWRTYTCRWCAEKFRRAARTGRKPEFCSDGCRDSARRDHNFAVSGSTGGNGQANPRNATKTRANSSISTGAFRGRGFDLAGVEPAVRERIIDLSFPGWKWAHPHEDGAAQ